MQGTVASSWEFGEGKNRVFATKNGRTHAKDQGPPRIKRDGVVNVW